MGSSAGPLCPRRALCESSSGPLRILAGSSVGALWLPRRSSALSKQVLGWSLCGSSVGP